MVTEEGSLCLRAYRLNDRIMRLLKDKDFSRKILMERKFSFEEFLEEIPVKITNTSLTNAFLYSLDNSFDSYEDLPLSDNKYLLKNIEGMVQCINDLSKENNTFVIWQKKHFKTRNYATTICSKKKTG